MIPFRPKATEELDSSNRNSSATEPQKPSIDCNPLVDGFTTNPDGSEETTQTNTPITAPDRLTTEQLRRLATYRPPPVPPSDAAPSSGGKSLSCPTEYEAYRPYKRPSRVIDDAFLNSLFDHHPYDDTIRLKPLELPATTGDAAGPFSGPLPWKFEFSWSSELLFFDGEQLSTSPLPGSPSEASGAVVGGSSLASATGFTVQESVVSAGATDRKSLAEACFREGEIQKAVSERRENLIDLLEDHYWRTRPPQRTNKRNSAARHSGVDTSSRTSSSVDPSTPRTSGKLSAPRKGRGITGGEGNGDDDDDEQKDDDGQHGLRQTKPKTVNRYFACPYLKWKPQKYNRCLLRFRNISYMIEHLEERHYRQRCPTCWRVYATSTQMKNHQKSDCGGSMSSYPDPSSIDPNEITTEKLAMIRSRRKYQACDSENQWNNIYRILFPGSPLPRSIYTEGNAMDEYADGLLSFLETDGDTALARFQHENSCEDPFAYAFETRAQQSQAVRNGFLTRFMAHFISEYMADGSGTGQTNAPSEQSDGQSEALPSSPHDSSNTHTTKGKSVRFGRPTTYAFSTLSALTEEEPPESTSGPSSHTIDSSSHGSLSIPSYDTMSSVAHNADDDFSPSAAGGKPISGSDQEGPVPAGQQQIDPHDLCFPPVAAWSGFTITPAIQSSNFLDLELGLDGEAVDCSDTTKQHTLSGCEPSTLDLNGDFTSTHGTPGDLQAEYFLSGLSASCWEEKSLEPNMTASSVYNELAPPAPWSPSAVFDLGDFSGH